MSILLSGSLAFDHIMVFPGHFEDHILPDKIHILNVSFLVDSLDRLRGGVAGNIAYNLALLREPCRIVATVGTDFEPYSRLLQSMGVDVSGISVIENELTASAFITTDRADNQITGFYPGAMSRAGDLSLQPHIDGTRIAVVSPTDPKAMHRHVRELAESRTRYVFDPGQQIVSLPQSALVEGIEGAEILVGNDYEFAMMGDKSGMTREELERACPTVIVTFGELGSRIRQGDMTIDIPAARAEAVVDPTGAGDAYRAGFLVGRLAGFPIEVAGRVGSLAATFTVESKGTQGHQYNVTDFVKRFDTTFPEFAGEIRSLLTRAEVQGESASGSRSGGRPDERG